MLDLSRHYGKGPKSMTEISKNQNIPVKYLEQIIIPLKRAKLVISARGPKGGHMLAKSPDKISLWEILLLLENKVALVDCLTDETACEKVESCPVRKIWGRAYNAMMDIFKETTLSDVLQLNGSITDRTS
jgi:Rrf2 family protein